MPLVCPSNCAVCLPAYHRLRRCYSSVWAALRRHSTLPSQVTSKWRQRGRPGLEKAQAGQWVSTHHLDADKPTSRSHPRGQRYILFAATEKEAAPGHRTIRHRYQCANYKIRSFYKKSYHQRSRLGGAYRPVRICAQATGAGKGHETVQFLPAP